MAQFKATIPKHVFPETHDLPSETIDEIRIEYYTSCNEVFLFQMDEDIHGRAYEAVLHLSKAQAEELIKILGKFINE